MDTLSRLLGRFDFRAHVFYNGTFCGTNRFIDEGKAGQLHLLRRGRAVMHHEDRSALHLDVPTLVLYPRGLSHRLVAPEDEPAQLLCAEILFEGGSQSALAKVLPDCVHWPLGQDPGAARLLALLFDEAESPRSGQQAVLNRLCEALIVQVIRHALQTCGIAPGLLAGLADPGLSRTLVAIHNEPGDLWTLNAMALQASMSRSKFARHFHAVVGMPPAEYLAERRMELARKLLVRDKPVITVAHRVGYASQPAFTKAFTARHGLSPRAWLQSVRTR